MPSRKRILFITAHRLGDAVLSLASLHALARYYSEARFTIICGPDVANLFAAIPFCEAVVTLRKKSCNRHWLDLWLKTVRKRWFIVVDLRSSIISLGLWAGKRVIIGGGRREGHKLEQHREALARILPDHISGDKERFIPHLWISEEDRRFAASLLPARCAGPCLALAPTAGWEEKIWPAKYFMDLATRFLGLGYQIILLYGPGAREQKLMQPWRDFCAAHQNCHDWGGRYTLGQIAALLSHCRLFIGNDSGLMHLAAATQIPCLGLFGPTSVVEYAPSGRYACNLSATASKRGDMRLLECDIVFRKAVEMITISGQEAQ